MRNIGYLKVCVCVCELIASWLWPNMDIVTTHLMEVSLMEGSLMEGSYLLEYVQ